VQREKNVHSPETMSSFSDTESERNVVYDMCFEPTLDPSDPKYRGLAMPANDFESIAVGVGGSAGLSGGHSIFDLSEKMAPLFSEGKADAPANEEAAPTTLPPRFQSNLLPRPSSMVLCALSPEEFVPFLNQTLEAHNCVRCQTASGGFFSMADESKWSWRFSHVSPLCAQVDLQVSVWDVTGSDYERTSAKGTTAFAVEFSRVGGDGFVWNALRADLMKDLEGSPCGFIRPQEDVATKRPTFQMKPALQMGADAPEPMEQADESMFQPLLAMLFQQSARMQLEALRACYMLVNSSDTNLQVFATLFTQKARLFNTFEKLMASGTPEAQRLVVAILFKTAVGSRTVLECLRMQCSKEFRHIMESTARGERLKDRDSIQRSKAILELVSPI
jgi:hypothetical protein